MDRITKSFGTSCTFRLVMTGIGYDPSVVVEPRRSGALGVSIILAFDDLFWVTFDRDWALESDDFVEGNGAEDWAFDLIDRVARFGAYRLGLFGMPFGSVIVPKSAEEVSKAKKNWFRRGNSWEPWSEISGSDGRLGEGRL